MKRFQFLGYPSCFGNLWIYFDKICSLWIFYMITFEYKVINLQFEMTSLV